MRSQQLLGGRYRIEDQLGAGGMATVWKGHDEVLDRVVAIKVLAGAYAADPVARARIRAEAQAAARLWHPNVTDVHDYGESTDEAGQCVPYVVMELLPGRTLAERLAEGPLPPRSALRTCAQVADAVAAAHAQRLVHRDIKPSNVMLTPSGAKVLDFGIAAVAGREQAEADGQLLGSPAFLAPERLAGGEVVPASDVYALGLLIYCCLTGSLPWPGETTTQLLASNVAVEPAPLPVIDGVPAEVGEVCLRCLDKDPANRPAAADVAAVLAEAAGMSRPADEDLGRAPGPGAVPPALLADLPGPATRSAATAEPVTVGAGSDIGADHDHRRRRAGALVGALVVTAAVAVSAALALTGQERRVEIAAPGTAAAGGADVPVGDDTSPAVSPTSAIPEPSGAPSGPTGSAGGTALTNVTPGPPVANPQPGVLVSALGGAVRVRCTANLAVSVGMQLASGYRVKEYRPGPADEVRLVLTSPANESEIKVRCPGGQLEPRVKERRK